MNKAVNFESLLDADPEVAYRGPDYHSVAAIRTQISQLTNKAENSYIKAYNLEKEHTTSV